MNRAGWQLVTASVPGPRRRRNQDCAGSRELGGQTQPVLAFAVADGHGAKVHHLSHLGSRFAVEAFFTVVQRFAEGGPEQGRSLQPPQDRAQPGFSRQLVQTWQRQVADDASAANAAHTAPANAAHTAPARSDQVDYVPYGTTLVGAVLTPRLLAAWQIGDGEFAVVDGDGRIAQPLAPATEEFGDEVDSLCSPGAEHRIRSHRVPIEDRKDEPSMVLACTDGLSKSFTGNAEFLKFVGGLHARLGEHGAGTLAPRVEDWLTTAGSFSGDDATLVVAWRSGADR